MLVTIKLTVLLATGATAIVSTVMVNSGKRRSRITVWDYVWSASCAAAIVEIYIF